MQSKPAIMPRAVNGCVEIILWAGGAESAIPVSDPLDLSSRIVAAYQEAQYQRVVPPALGGGNGR